MFLFSPKSHSWKKILPLEIRWKLVLKWIYCYFPQFSPCFPFFTVHDMWFLMKINQNLILLKYEIFAQKRQKNPMSDKSISVAWVEPQKKFIRMISDLFFPVLCRKQPKRLHFWSQNPFFMLIDLSPNLTEITLFELKKNSATENQVRTCVKVNLLLFFAVSPRFPVLNGPWHVIFDENRSKSGSVEMCIC